MWKTTAVAILTAAALAACAHPMTPAPDMALANPSPNSNAISAGASDEIGKLITAANQSQRQEQEASAAPTH